MFNSDERLNFEVGDIVTYKSYNLNYFLVLNVCVYKNLIACRMLDLQNDKISDFNAEAFCKAFVSELELVLK